jgi:molybdopterin-guanine dinucleotide biosynthesis protein A
MMRYTPEPTPAGITLAVLAGGEGSRMGRPKGELCLGNRPILEFLLDRWNWPGPTMLVTAPGREKPPGAESFSREVVDAVAGQGPLRGILTAMESAVTESVVFTTVDMPGVGRPQLNWIAGRSGTLGTMMSRSGAIEPFPSILRVSAIEIVRRRLDAGRRSVHGLSEEPGFEIVPVPEVWEASVWLNLNTPQDWDVFESRTRGE